VTLGPQGLGLALPSPPHLGRLLHPAAVARQVPLEVKLPSAVAPAPRDWPLLERPDSRQEERLVAGRLVAGRLVAGREIARMK
jgi:hypothetical protein